VNTSPIIRENTTAHIIYIPYTLVTTLLSTHMLYPAMGPRFYNLGQSCYPNNLDGVYFESQIWATNMSDSILTLQEKQMSMLINTNYTHRWDPAAMVPSLRSYSPKTFRLSVIPNTFCYAIPQGCPFNPGQTAGVCLYAW
jgi:hypothetical protein